MLIHGHPTPPPWFTKPTTARIAQGTARPPVEGRPRSSNALAAQRSLQRSLPPLPPENKVQGQSERGHAARLPGPQTPTGCWPR
eukprot:scaffold6330_cov107-Isochrysis_galbana.AAC.1